MNLEGSSKGVSNLNENENTNSGIGDETEHPDDQNITSAENTDTENASSGINGDKENLEADKSKDNAAAEDTLNANQSRFEQNAYGQDHQSNGFNNGYNNSFNNGYGNGYNNTFGNGYNNGYMPPKITPDPRSSEQRRADLFNNETPLPHNTADEGTKDSAKANRILTRLLSLALCMIFGFFGAAIGIYTLAQTSLVDENSMLSKWIIDASGLYVNKVVVDESNLEYTGDNTELAEKLVKTVVEIIELEKNDDGEYEEKGYASGVVISADGYIITNQHVTDGADALKVKFYDGTVYYAYAESNGIVGEDSIKDIALVKINPEKELAYATLGSSSGVKYAQQVIVIGNPLGLGTSVTFGVVSCPDRELTDSGSTNVYIQTDASVSPGNSGGGMFDVYGNLIGMICAKSVAEGVEGVGYAIPIDTVKAITADLATYGYTKGRAALGVTVASIYTKTAYEYYGTNNYTGTNAGDLVGYLFDYRYGVYVVSCTNPDAPLEKGDRLRYFNGVFVSSADTLTSEILKLSAGDKVDVIVERIVGTNEDGSYNVEEITVEITLMERTW